MKIKSFISTLIAVVGISLSCSNTSTKQDETPLGTAGNDSKIITTDNELLALLEQYAATVRSEFEQIPLERKEQLKELARFVKTKSDALEPSKLIFICTHNSRRSHMSQLWAQTAAHYYGVADVHCFSGGTEATAFNPRSVRALRKAGFNIEQSDSSSNPVYLVKFTEGVQPLKGFSKKYDDESNPQANFAAVMTCSQADEACPLVHGAAIRVAIPYEDPKVADNTPAEEAKYDERCRQIATEMFYIFSQVKS